MTTVLALALAAFGGFACILVGLWLVGLEAKTKPVTLTFAKIRNGHLPDIGQRKRH